MKHIFLTTISLLAGLVLHAQDINSGQRTINCQGRTYDINRTFSSIAVADNSNADFPAFANGTQSLPINTQTRQQYMTFQGDNWMYPFKHEADCERVFDSVQEVFCIRELSTLARSADELYVACTVNPQNGHTMELKFTVYNLHDNVLVNNISVRKLAALEDQLKANLIFDSIPSEYQDASFVLGV